MFPNELVRQQKAKVRLAIGFAVAGAAVLAVLAIFQTFPSPLWLWALFAAAFVFFEWNTVEVNDKLFASPTVMVIMTAAVAMFPLLKRTPIEDHWAGLRPGSPSGIPYIGTYPEVEGLFINAGHFRNGLVTGPASARLLADLVLSREPILPPSPYALDAPRG